MKKVIKPIILLIIMLGIVSYADAQKKTKSLYDFTVKTLEGAEFPLSQLKGKKVMVVNTASKCGLTPQYKDLQALYAQYGGNGFVIVGFPANNFREQEPGTSSEIREFCTANYGVTFPMMEKVSVTGDDIAPVYRWLTSKTENGVMDAPIQWNFQKFLIDENGNLVDMVPPREKADSPKVIAWLTKK
jgi:glutathione peroxidase